MIEEIKIICDMIFKCVLVIYSTKLICWIIGKIT